MVFAGLAVFSPCIREHMEGVGLGVKNSIRHLHGSVWYHSIGLGEGSLIKICSGVIRVSEKNFKGNSF